MSSDKKKFLGMFFKESVNRRKEKCFIGKVRVPNEGDLIVIANPNLCEVSKMGRWDVEVEPIKQGKGFFVTSAKFSRDELSIVTDIDGGKVSVLVNGRENKLKRRMPDGEKYIPLVYDIEQRHSVRKVVVNIEEKIGFLQLDPEFSVSKFINEFEDACEVVINVSSRKGHFKDYVPNTPMADLLKHLKS